MYAEKEKMSRSSRPTVITPEIQNLMNRWIDFALQNDIEVDCGLDYWAKVCVEHGGACNCRPSERPICPCGECLSEINKNGHCFCRIFKSHEYAKNIGW